MSISGQNWLVDQTPVVRAPGTIVIEKRGAAEVGAWVLVVGDQYPDRLEADTIQVLRPAGAPTPVYQITGVLLKKASQIWFIEDNPISITPTTRMVGSLDINTVVRATVLRLSSGFQALEVRAIAPNAASLPFAIEGIVEAVTGDSWVVDDQTIVVPPEQGVLAGQGDTVEVAALKDGHGSLVAQQARIVDVSLEAQVDGYVTAVNGLGEDNQTWTLLVFEGGRTEQRTINVSPETYVDEDRAVIEPEVEARVQGVKGGATTVDAALVRLEQPVAAIATGALTTAGPNELWRVGDQEVWFASGELEQAAEAAASEWDGASQQAADPGPTASLAVRGVRLSNGVLIAKEVLTAEAAAAAGLLNEAGSAMDVTSLTADDWKGPTGINPYVSSASKPTVLFDASGAGHAVYESAGQIYYAYQPPKASWQSPVKIGTGFKPTAVFDANGQLHVAYTNEFLGNYDILHVNRTSTGWSLPRVVAPTSGRSEDPVIVADTGGKVYVAWMDFTSGEWAIQIGMWDGRYWTSYPVSNARGQSPSLALMPDGALFLAWQDRIPLGLNTWGNYDIFASERWDADRSWSLPVNVSDNRTFRPGSDSLGARLVTTAEADPGGLAHIAWIDDKVQVRYVYGHGLYWPIPVDVTDRRALARGLSMRKATDGLLYLAWDEGVRLSVTAGPPRTKAWAGSMSLAIRASPADGGVSDVSLSVGNGGVAISWVQDNLSGGMGVYESRHNMSGPPRKSYLPLLMAP